MGMGTCSLQHLHDTDGSSLRAGRDVSNPGEWGAVRLRRDQE